MKKLKRSIQDVKKYAHLKIKQPTSIKAGRIPVSYVTGKEDQFIGSVVDIKRPNNP